VAETILQYNNAVPGPDGASYRARACGGQMDDGLWQGWIEFTPLGGGAPMRSGRETTQPNRADLVYWATGLSAVYLEGALKRALEGPIVLSADEVEPPAFDGPEPPITERPAGESVHGVLDPFSVFEKGEALLRKQLGALSSWHLVNIIREYDLSREPAATLSTFAQATLIEIIVSAVRAEMSPDSTSLPR
jgi:hypothetical protein